VDAASKEREMRLNLGSADDLRQGFVNVDIAIPEKKFPAGAEFYQADLTKPWPWDDSSVDFIFARDIVEHLPDKVHTLNEAWRVLKPGALIEILVPDACGPGQWQDPTHKSGWVMNSFQYFEHGSFALGRVGKAYGIKAAFRVIKLTKRDYPDVHEKVPKIEAVLEAVK
ncbi:MAG: class I SAM-dependent methyltransferase, partial [Planctomycetota bacterium]